MALKVAFHPLAEADLFGLYDYVASKSGSTVASGYLDRIEALCGSLAIFPQRGAPRDDLGPGVRTIAMQRRLLVVYRPGPEDVVILRVFYAGRDLGPDSLPQ